jgi:hypothetical protein
MITRWEGSGLVAALRENLRVIRGALGDEQFPVPYFRSRNRCRDRADCDLWPYPGFGTRSRVMSMLDGSPFTSFVVPGLILLAVVGGTQILAAVLQIRLHPASLLWMAFAGFTMIVWILVETVVIHGFGLLQALYFATGALQIVLTLALLGIVAWVPRIDLRVARARP